MQKESNYCMHRLNKVGGDSGCMQFTNPAINELKHQFGFVGSDKHTSGMPEVLTYLISRYFGQNNPQRVEEFKKWFKQDIPSLKNSLRSGDQFEFEIIAGSLFIKFQLALAKGNYGIAVRNYNGSAAKLTYQESVIANSQKITDSSSQTSIEECYRKRKYEETIMKLACDLTDDPEECKYEIDMDDLTRT